LLHAAFYLQDGHLHGHFLHLQQELAAQAGQLVRVFSGASLELRRCGCRLPTALPRSIACGNGPRRSHPPPRLPALSLHTVRAFRPPPSMRSSTPPRLARSRPWAAPVPFGEAARGCCGSPQAHSTPTAGARTGWMFLQARKSRLPGAPALQAQASQRGPKRWTRRAVFGAERSGAAPCFERVVAREELRARRLRLLEANSEVPSLRVERPAAGRICACIRTGRAIDR
jgi:hypothetical protein